MQPNDIQALIERQFEALSPELRRAARWVAQHGPALGLQSMRASAREAGVSAATMTRLARQLGLPGFEALREPFRSALASRAPGAESFVERAHSQRGKDARGKLPQRLVAAQQADARSWSDLNPPGGLEAAARRMLRSRQVVFLGLRASFGLAYHLHYTYSLLCPNGRLLQDLGGALHDRLDGLGPKDLLVAVSQAPYTRETVLAAQAAVSAGVPVLALTDNSLSPIARGAAQTLLFAAASPAFFQSMTGAQALAEALVATVADQGGAAVIDHLADRQAHLQARKAYWERPARPVPPRKS